MTYYRDNLGQFIIPDELWHLVKDYQPIIKDIPSTLMENSFEEWTVVKKIQASNGSSIHVVSRKGNELRCTCKSFKIRNKGISCKHVEFVKSELGL